MEQAAAGLGGSTPVSSIMDTLSSLADTLHLAPTNGAAGDQMPPPSSSQPVDVSGMLQSLSAAVPALGGTSSATAAAASSMQTLTSEAHATSVGLSGLGNQLLQLQEQLQVSQDPEPASNTSKHRGTAAAIAAALQRSTPKVDTAPAAPDFTLLSETVSESLHNLNHKPEPHAPKPSPSPPITPPVSDAGTAPSMKPHVKAPDPAMVPPPLHAEGHRMMPLQPRPPPPPSAPRPQIHQLHRHDANVPPQAPAAAAPRGPPARPPPEPHLQTTGVQSMKHGSPLPSAVPLNRTPKPPSRLGPQVAGRQAAQAPGWPMPPPPGRPVQLPPRPPPHRATGARPEGQKAPATSRSWNGPPKPAEAASGAAPEGGVKAESMVKAEGAPPRSVVHPLNPLKRVPVATAQALKSTEQPAKANAGGAGANAASAMHRLVAAKVAPDRKKFPQPPDAPSAAPAHRAPGEESNGDVRPGPPGMHAARAAAASASGSMQPTASDETASATAKRLSETEGRLGQGVGAIKPDGRETSPVIFQPLQAGPRQGDKRVLPAAQRPAEERPLLKRQRQQPHAPDRIRVETQKPVVAKATPDDLLSRQHRIPSDGALRQARTGGKVAPSSAADAKKGDRQGRGVGEAYARQLSDVDSARPVLPTAKMKRVGNAAAARSEPGAPAHRKPAGPGKDASSDDDDMVLLAQHVRTVRARQGRSAAPRAAADAGAGVPQRHTAASPRRVVSQSPPRRRKDEPGQTAVALGAVRRAAKAVSAVERYPHPAAPFGAPEPSRPVWRDGWGRSQAAGMPSMTRADRPAVAESAVGRRRAAGSDGVAQREAAGLKPVTHDVEIQTESPDVRDSSMQTTMLWGRSTACQTEMSPPPSPQAARPRPMVSTSVQCDMGVSAGGCAAASVRDPGEAYRESADIGMALQAIRQLHNMHASSLFSPEKQQALAAHISAIRAIVAPGTSLAEDVPAEAEDSRGNAAWEEGAGGDAAVPAEGAHGSGSDMELPAGGTEAAGVEGDLWEDSNAAPMADSVSAGDAEPEAEVAAMSGGLASPRLEQRYAVEDAACSPDEVQLLGGLSREDSPDEVPVATGYDNEAAAQESDDGAPLAPIASDPPLWQAGPQQGGQNRRGAGVGAPAQSEGSSDASVASDGEDSQVVRAAILSRLRKLLPKADLSVATAKSVRARLEFSLRRDLQGYMAFIKEAIAEFLEDADAFSVETAEEAALAARLSQAAAAAPRPRATAGDGSRAGPAAAGPPPGGGAAAERGRAAGGPGGAAAAAAGRDTAAAEGRSPPALNLVGRLNGSSSVAPKRKGPAVLYCPAPKSAKERFRTTMTPEQLQEAKAAARAGLD
eukprot:jgi/Ulvmu1/5036/UM021_0053.1